MEKIIIYEKNGEILIIGNADNVDLLTEYVGLLTNNPFRKRYTSYCIAKTKYKLLSTDNFCLALDVLDRLVEQSTL